MRRVCVLWTLGILTLAACSTGPGNLVEAADEPASAVGAVMRLMQSQRVPEERLPAIVEIVGARGNSHDLAYLFQQATTSDWPVSLRRQSLQLLVDAARNRKVVPDTDLSPLAALIGSGETDAALRSLAVQLAGATRSASAFEPVAAVARDAHSPLDLRKAALETLVQIAPARARPTIDQLLGPAQTYEIRAAAVTALGELDLQAASAQAARLLEQAAPEDDPAAVIDALLERRGGSERLAAALAGASLSADVAKLSLRHMYSIGRSDEELAGRLSQAAGFDADPQPLTPAEIATLEQDVRDQGDASRGEQVFRRSDLSCMKCHSVSAAGGQVGPDLSPVGSISPLDYLINSVTNPDLAIKEAFITRVVATADGQVIQGIVVDRSSERLVLKDAQGVVRTIATADIDQEIEGKSLMPKGLVRFMTRTELIDLIKFLSQLGRPGGYAIRSTPRFQRYRVLLQAPADALAATPNDEQFEALIYRSSNWVPLYARVDGTVPLDEAAQRAGSRVVYLYAEFEVTHAGPIGLVIDSPAGVSAWLDDGSIDLGGGTCELQSPLGRHRVTLRIEMDRRPSAGVELELSRIPGSSAEFRPVDGS